MEYLDMFGVAVILKHVLVTMLNDELAADKPGV
jgi:hypothetical protein